MSVEGSSSLLPGNIVGLCIRIETLSLPDFHSQKEAREGQGGRSSRSPDLGLGPGHASCPPCADQTRGWLHRDWRSCWQPRRPSPPRNGAFWPLLSKVTSTQRNVYFNISLLKVNTWKED